jgi:hypothetical protein
MEEISMKKWRFKNGKSAFALGCVLVIGFAALCAGLVLASCDQPTSTPPPPKDGGFEFDDDIDEEYTGVEVTSLTLDQSALIMTKNVPVQLVATVNPVDVPVVWLSSNPAGFPVTDDGTVTPLIEGEATIQAKAGGKKATCTVSVPKKAGLFAGIGDDIDEDSKDLSAFEGTMLKKSFAWINANGAASGQYTIILSESEEDTSTGTSGYAIGTGITSGVAYAGMTGAGKTNLKIVLKGNKDNQSILSDTPNTETDIVITKTGTGALFTVYGGAAGDIPELVLEDITLQGNTGNTSALVDIGVNNDNKKGMLNMQEGSRITGNTSTGNMGGGVRVRKGEFTMEGGRIDHNKTTHNTGNGGGIYCNGTMTMTAGLINCNEAGNGTGAAMGGGVAGGGVFTMSGGTISENEVKSSNASSRGGGIYFAGNFTMRGTALIENNKANQGAGVGFIFSNTNEKTFKMEGGSIENNTGETCSAIYIGSSSTSNIPIFQKTGGTVYGSDDGTKPNGFTGSVSPRYVIGVYKSTTLIHFHNDTASDDVHLDSEDATNWNG